LLLLQLWILYVLLLTFLLLLCLHKNKYLQSSWR
jgi:hypothetical protein